MMNILRASAEHISDALPLLDEFYREVGVIKTDTLEAVEGLIAGESSGLWIAFVDDVPAGCVVLQPLPSIPRAGECRRLYVRPRFRRRGISSALLDAMEAEARRMGWAEIDLDTKDDLVDAIRLYENRGYRRRERYNDNAQATLFFRKRLDASIAPN